MYQPLDRITLKSGEVVQAGNKGSFQADGSVVH